MSYLVFCTFDLKNATSTDYQNAYLDLAKLGLTKVVTSDKGGKIVVPTTSAMGFFNGVSAGAVRDDIRTEVQTAFKSRRFTSEIFVIVGGDWAWGSNTT
jgi:hypothetical protein